MLAPLPVLLLIGLFLPGFFIARYLRHKLWWASGFTISLVVLFHSVFWVGVLGAGVHLWTVLPCLIAVSAAMAFLAKRPPGPIETIPKRNFAALDRALILSSCLVGAVLLVHSARAPLMGGDMLYRWDFLAQRIFATGSFSYYPPLTPVDFKTYFYVDGIPPMVSFVHWWLYTSAGQYLPWLLCFFVAAQFGATLAFTYGAAEALFSRRAGVIAGAMLAGSTLFFRSVVAGQETGLTALSMAATIYFLVSAREPEDNRAIVSAGLSAGLCCLSREYGWVALIAGAIALAWRRQPLKQAAIFGAVTIAVAGPWYIRTWILAGNPFYSLRLLRFPVNPVHDAILQYYNAALGIQRWTAGYWQNMFVLLILLAPCQFLIGVGGGFTRFRKHGYLLVTALLLIGVWLQSVGYTSGGAEASVRVLTPALVVLSIIAAGIADPLAERARGYAAVTLVIVACQIWAAGQGAVYPKSLLNLPAGRWFASAFPIVPPNTEFQIRDQLVRILPPGQRVLTDGAYIHAALIDKGIEVVPVWSPEVRFLFSSSAEESERQLRALHIGTVVCYNRTLNLDYLRSNSPFYAALTQRWRLLARAGDGMFIFVPGGDHPNS